VGGGGTAGKPAILLYLVLRYDLARTGAQASSAASAAWLSDAMVDCANGRSGTIGRVAALVGTEPSQSAATAPATSVLVTRPDSITWLFFDGDGWTPSERERVAALAVTRLTS
jgi:hypothetical protein